MVSEGTWHIQWQHRELRVSWMTSLIFKFFFWRLPPLMNSIVGIDKVTHHAPLTSMGTWYARSDDEDLWAIVCIPASSASSEYELHAGFRYVGRWGRHARAQRWHPSKQMRVLAHRYLVHWMIRRLTNMLIWTIRLMVLDTQDWLKSSAERVVTA